MPSKKSSLTSVQAALQTIRQDVEDLRDRRSNLLDQIEETESTSLTDAEIKVRVEALLDRVEVEARSAMDLWSFSARDGDTSGLPEIFGTEMRTLDVGVIRPAGKQNTLGALCLFGFREQIRDRLVAEAIAARVSEPMGHDEREANLSRLRGQVRDCELAEERAIREAEEAGLTLPRRADADPALFLAEEVL